MKQPLPPHSVLPVEAIALLQRAAKTPVTDADPLARVKAIEQATAKVKREYPTYFQKEY